ncbi:hypothetical protein SAMN05216223_106249 [Actinacidiphila yanglinensis]|uniref:Uncharacterized protein n=1 Tax=Actinacidiphila yanglinensis TaxID=310779 RepID=A0A1H6B602_9ACTN|nr:hypothetical protein [Actinacidiphila yanglinensis]SEG56060.1 hypothetical protein SAMN05216223_106249 [Actinacidiphila yanglinensis]
MNSGQAPFSTAVADFEAAVRARDSQASGDAFALLQQTFQGADDTELAAVAPRLAALLPEVPAGPRSVVAVVVGAAVERGADPVGCAPTVLAALGEALAGAEEFVARWEATGGGDLPDPEKSDPQDEVFDRVGQPATEAWWTLPQWEMAAVAVLNHKAVRLAVADRAALVDAAERVGDATGGGLKYLRYMLAVLDDEPLVVLHRETGTGYRVRISGLGDNFQLHTLLAGELVGGGHVPGVAPSEQAVAVCRSATGDTDTTGSFNLVAPDGTWIWNEGIPADIPVVDGVRLLVLDPPPYERAWPAGRLFSQMPGELVLEGPLGSDEAASWLARTSPAKEG